MKDFTNLHLGKETKPMNDEELGLVSAGIDALGVMDKRIDDNSERLDKTDEKIAEVLKKLDRYIHGTPPY